MSSCCRTQPRETRSVTTQIQRTETVACLAPLAHAVAWVAMLEALLLATFIVGRVSGQDTAGDDDGWGLLILDPACLCVGVGTCGGVLLTVAAGAASIARQMGATSAAATRIWRWSAAPVTASTLGLGLFVQNIPFAMACVVGGAVGLAHGATCLAWARRHGAHSHLGPRGD